MKGLVKAPSDTSEISGGCRDSPINCHCYGHSPGPPEYAQDFILLLHADFTIEILYQHSI